MKSSFRAGPCPALLTDLYELTMAQAYWREGKQGNAVFSLACRSLPECRNYIVACGLDDVLDYLEHFAFSSAARAYLRSLRLFSEDFLDWLKTVRFTGSVRAVPEGTPLFGGEPILEIEGPLAVVQLAETAVLNIVHAQTLAASKASRIASAARGKHVADFGLRRMHGGERATTRVARACHIAGITSTSNVRAGAEFHLPVTGTMAHSYVQSHATELEAFRTFASMYPETTLLVDTYDTLTGVDNVIRLAEELGEAFRVKAIRLDSGDLAELSKAARAKLDQAGLSHVSIFASGNLDEYRIRELLEQGAAIDGFGVGTLMGVSADAPSLDMTYKLTSLDGQDCIKLSTNKISLPGPKQIFRVMEHGHAVRDVIAGKEESLPGIPLLHTVMKNGERIAPAPTIAESRETALAELRTLPEEIRELAPAAYPVEISAGLLDRLEAFRKKDEK